MQITLEGMKKYSLWVGFAIIVSALIFVILGIFEDNDSLKSYSLWFTSIGIAMISIGIAYHSVITSEKSNKKMKALVNLNFVEKHAMMQQYIRSFKKRSFTCIDQCKLDLEAAIEVKKWPSENRKKKYIGDLINLKEIALKKNIPKKHKKTLENILEIALEFGIEEDKLKECRQQVSKFIPKRRRK